MSHHITVDVSYFSYNSLYLSLFINNNYNKSASLFIFSYKKRPQHVCFLRKSLDMEKLLYYKVQNVICQIF